MREYKSSYEILIEELTSQQKVKDLTEDQNFDLVLSLNKAMAVGEAEIRTNEVEAERELAHIVLNS